MTLVNKSLSEKPVDKLEETNTELSQYSSISTSANLWTANRLWQRKNRQKLTKRHRFPPSLLSSRAADFWNTLMPLRANCSCSSVSVSDMCSRLSFGVSVSDATVGSNSDSFIPLIKETAVQKTLGDTIEHTHLAFELLIARMVRLLNILNEKAGSSLSHIYSGSKLKTLPKLVKSSEMITGDSCGRFPSITSLSSDSSNHYRDHWTAERKGKKCESLSKFEIAGQKRLPERGFFSRTTLVPKSLRVPKSVLTKEELVYLLEYKKTLLSEYFQRKVDSTDLNKSLPLSERKSFIYETQSDSRLREDNLLQFVQFIRARKKKDAEAVLEKKFRSLVTQKPNTNLLSASLNSEDCHNISTPKRRVTFSDPLPKKTTTLLNCCSSDNEDGISSAQSFTTAIENDIEMLDGENIQSDGLFDSEFASPSVSSVSLKSCSANLSLESLSTKAHDSNPDLILIKPTTEKTVREKNITDEVLNSTQSDNDDEIKSLKNSPGYVTSDVYMAEKVFRKKRNVVSMMTARKSQLDENVGLLKKSSGSSLLSSLQKLSKSDIVESVEIIEREKPRGLKFLVKEILDSGTTHLPILNDIGPSVILKVDDATPRITFEECNPQQTFEKCLKRNICPIEIRENRNSLDDDHRDLNRELEELGLIRNKITRFSNIQQSGMPLECDQQQLYQSFSKEQKFSDTDMNGRTSWPSRKTVTFQDCCKTMSDQSIISYPEELQPLLQSDKNSVSSSESKGQFELSWKGCWDQQSTTDSVQNGEHLVENSTDDEGRLVGSNTTVITSESVVFIPIETHGEERDLLSNNHELSSTISGSQTSCYITMQDEIRLANNFRSRYISRNLRAASPTSYSHPSNIPSFTEVAASLERDEIIPWISRSKEDSSKSSKPISELNYGFESNPEAMELRNRTKLRRGFANVCKGIRYPEIWRSEVKSEAKALSKSDWYARHSSDKYPWKTPGIRSDWLIHKLEELQSSPETDYESDYYAESEAESDYECDKNLSLIKRSFSNLGTRPENWKKYKMKRNRFRPDLFLNKVWSSKKIVFNECRCHKNTPRNRNNLRPRDHDLRHTVLQESDQPSNQNFFSHLRARLILDSETDDSDFAPSIQPDFHYDFNRKDEHVNKMKCRRFVKSLKSIRSEEDRQFSSARLLHVTFKKSFSPASVQSALSTRTVGTNLSENQNCCNMMDVCMDTYDLCSCKPIGTTNQTSDWTYLNKSSSCQTAESLYGSLNSFQHTQGISEASKILVDRDTPSGSNFKVSRSNGQRMSSALANLSTQINNASNNLAKFRFSEIKTEPERVLLFPASKADDLITTPQIQSSPPILLRFSPAAKTFDSVQSSAEKSSNILNNSNSYTVEDSSCPICDARKKPTGRYALPSCIVKGVGPDSKTNEKDPWNRVMEQAKAQHRHEGRNSSTCLEMRQVASSAHESKDSKSSEGKQKSFVSHETQKDEVKIQLVQVKNNSSQAAAVCDLKHLAARNKITSPQRKDRPLVLPPAASAALCSSTSSDFPMPSLPEITKSQKRIRKPQAIPNKTNRLLYIISETAESTNQVPIKSAAANFFT